MTCPPGMDQLARVTMCGVSGLPDSVLLILWVSSVTGYTLRGLKKIPQCHGGPPGPAYHLRPVPAMTHGLILLSSMWCAPWLHPQLLSPQCLREGVSGAGQTEWSRLIVTIP